MTKILGLLVWSCSVLLGTISAAADLRAGPHVLGDLEQPQVRLVGVVRDGTGAVLQGVSVTVSGDALSTSRAVVTDNEGRYAFDGLPPGKYVVTTMAEGFEPRSVDVVVGTSGATQDIELPLSSHTERVTVTATKTGSADIQSTPLAITALSARTLDEMGASELFDLAGFLPAVTITEGAHQTQVKIRGIGTAAGPGPGDQSSTIHLDGVYLGRPAMAFMDFLDVERVEVLRGPQGTLYGRNSVGGTVNIVTRQPTNSLETSARIRAGNYSALRADGVISGPLIKDKVMGSFAFLRSLRDGFVKDLMHTDNSLGSEDSWAGRAQLRFVLGRRNEVLLSGDFAEREGVPLFFPKALVAKVQPPSFDIPESMWEVRASDPSSGRIAHQGLSAKLSVHLNETTTLNSLTAHRKSNSHLFFDPDGTELRIQTTEAGDHFRQLSQETTIVQRRPKLTWIGGAYFYDDSLYAPVELSQFTIGRDPIQIRPYSTTDTQAWALFGEATYSLTKRVGLTGGIRYTDERKRAHNTGGVYVRGTSTLVNPSSFYDFQDTASFDAWTPKVSVQVQAAPDTFIYLSATRGFKSGGFNPTANRTGLAYAPESVWSYEGGLKRTMAGGRVRVNAAAFYSDYQDLQVQTLIQTGVFFVSTGSATIKGLEVETIAAAGRGLQVLGQFSWLDATFDRFVAVRPGTTTEVDLPGNRLTYVPEWAGSGSAVYQFAVGKVGTTSLRGDLSWQGRVFYSAFNDLVESQGMYGLVHLRVAYEPSNKRWELAFYARNLGDQPYVTGMNSGAAFPGYNGRPGEPRQWGTQFTIRR
jgi:iron complex outermembrane receptor protein